MIGDDDAEELYEQAPCGYLSTTVDGMIVRVNETSVASERRDADEAGRLLGRVSALATSTTGALHGIEAYNYRGSAEAVIAAVGAKRFAELLEAGRAARPRAS